MLEDAVRKLKKEFTQKLGNNFWKECYKQLQGCILMMRPLSKWVSN